MVTALDLDHLVLGGGGGGTEAAGGAVGRCWALEVANASIGLNRAQEEKGAKRVS